MPTYHFQSGEGSNHKATINPKGKHRNISYISGEKQASISEGGGSLILIDHTLESRHKGFCLKKMHLPSREGSILMSPHLDDPSYHNEEGPRLDLWWLDGKYAELWVKELERRKDPEYRERIIEARYTKEYFNSPLRRRQLKISPDGLSRKIEEASELLKKGSYIYDTAAEMAETVYSCFGYASSLASFVEASAPPFMEGKPKIIIEPRIVPAMAGVHSVLHNTLSRIDEEIDPALEQRVRNYWADVVAWETL